MAHCTSVTKIETQNGVDIMLVQIDDVQAYWFYDYTEGLKFVDKEVIVSYRNDMYNGRQVTAINTIAVPSIVNVINKRDTFKLYSDASDNNANISFNEIGIGDCRDGCIFYCISTTMQASSAATWLELLIRDKSFRVAKLRVFDPVGLPTLEGKYCMATLRRTQYGLQTDLINPTLTECPPNPEIDIAREYILNFFADDVEAMSYINDTNFIKAMESHIDYEKGYALVRLAMELCMCEQLYNVTKDVDVKTLTHALLASYGFVTAPALPMSTETLSVMVAVRNKWTNLALLLSIIDPGKFDKEPEEKDLFKKLKLMVESIIDSRKSAKL